MTTTDTDALTERIARVLDPWVWTDEDDDPNTFRRLARRNNRLAERPASLARAAAVLPIVAAEVRKAKAEALREAAREEFQLSTNVHYQGVRVHKRLVERAYRIETGGSDEHR